MLQMLFFMGNRYDESHQCRDSRERRGLFRDRKVCNRHHERDKSGHRRKLCCLKVYLENGIKLREFFF
jgi:hypothetical protein